MPFSRSHSTTVSSNGKVLTPAITQERFATPFAACNFIVNWDGTDVRELFDAILCARRLGDRFIQDKLIEYILAIPHRNPRPDDVPAYAGAPVWAVDKSGRALVGMPGRETIVDSTALRKIRNGSGNAGPGADHGPVESVPKNGTNGFGM